MQWKFPDGAVGEKLIVTLNEPKANEPYIVCTATSKPKNKPKTPGCHAELGLFFIPASTEFFKKDTWLQLYALTEIEAKSFLQDHFQRYCEVKGKLSLEMIGQVVQCIRRCPDVTKHQLSLICR